MHKVIKTILVTWLALCPFLLFSQNKTPEFYTSQLSIDKLRSSVSFIANDLTKGRQTGTPGALITASYIRSELERMGMIPFYSQTLSQSFKIDSTHIGRNIIGVLTAQYYTDQYIVISAHYDHLGIIGGQIYNGADDNASGVASLLAIAELFVKMKSERDGPKKNIIFAFFDAKESSMAGSEYFTAMLPVKKSQIRLNINIDQVGCTFAPPGENKNYLLYVADSKVRGNIRKDLDIIRRFYLPDMDLDHTFYGSPSFYELFMRTSDHHSFSKAGIPSVMFTSGIHMHTYKPTDVHFFIDYAALLERTKLIFLFADRYTKVSGY
jgi:Zn-dependent M28 family amino/carboxypeptidase